MSSLIRTLTGLVGAAAMAATFAAQAQQPEAKGATIRGIVLDAVTASKLDATITLQDAERRPIKQVRTRGGEYQIADIPEGHFYLHAEAYGHVPQDYGQLTLDGPPLELALGAGGTYELSFTLDRTGIVTGRVLDPEGKPVSNAEVQLLVERFDPAGNRLLVAPTNVPPVRTGVGNFFIPSVPPGEYYIRATLSATGDAADPRAPVNHNVRTYYPGVQNPEQAVRIEMPKASTAITGLSMIFRDISRFKIRGRFVYPTTKIKEPLQIYLVPRDLRFSRVTDPPMPLADFDESRETFELRNVPRGAYDLYVGSITDYAPTPSGEPFTPGFMVHTSLAVLDADISGLTLELAPGVDLRGQFKLDGTAEAMNPNLVGSLPLFLSQDGMPWPLTPVVSANPSRFVRQDKSFDIVSTASGSYRVGAVLPENLYLSEVWLGPQNVTGQAFAIESRETGPLILEVSGDGARFEGTITNLDGAPAQAQVVLVPPSEFRNDPGTSKLARTDKDGRFTIAGIRPGAYMAYAFSKIENYAWLNEDFMNPYRALGLPLSFSRGSILVRDFKPVPPQR